MEARDASQWRYRMGEGAALWGQGPCWNSTSISGGDHEQTDSGICAAGGACTTRWCCSWLSSVHRAMTSRRKELVWTDDRGSVFVNDVDLLRSISPRSIVGTYDARTPMVAIEADLRLALRERASNWIIDWNVSEPVAIREEHAGESVETSQPVAPPSGGIQADETAGTHGPGWTAQRVVDVC